MSVVVRCRFEYVGNAPVTAMRELKEGSLKTVTLVEFLNTLESVLPSYISLGCFRVRNDQKGADIDLLSTFEPFADENGIVDLWIQVCTLALLVASRLTFRAQVECPSFHSGPFKEKIEQ